MDLAFTALRKLGAGPGFTKAAMEDLAQSGPLPPDAHLAEPSFTRAIVRKDGVRIPQAIAHRGYKSEFPENTMAAFRGAVSVGVQALETDVHVTQDGVVVLSHDPSLKRCYGVDRKIAECNWKSLRELRTTKEPHEPLPSFEDLLWFLAEPGVERIWVLIDIKLDNDPDRVMRAMADIINRVTPAPGTRWQDRIILGCWAARFMPACANHLPTFPVTNIGFAVAYARQFLNPSLAHISFNMLFPVLLTPSGRRFITSARTANRAVYAWTVNEEAGWEWCIRRGLDGVISDDPKRYLDYVKRRESDGQGKLRRKSFTLKELKGYLVIAAFMWAFDILFWWGYGYQGITEKLLAKKRRGKSDAAGSGRVTKSGSKS